MPLNDKTKSDIKTPEVYRLYYWLTVLDLDRGLKEYETEKGYNKRISDDSIDGVNVIDYEKYVNHYKELPLYKRIFFSIFSPFNEFIDLFYFYKAKQILQKLAIKADFDAVKWQETLNELKELDRLIQKNLPFINLKYLWARIVEWPVKPKNKDYMFNNVKYAFSNTSNWNIGELKTLNIQECEKMKDIDDLTEYFQESIKKECEDIEPENITDEKIEFRKSQILGFKESISSYYYCPSWDFNVKDKCVETVRILHDYLALAINKVMSLLPFATYNKCLCAFRKEQTPANSEKLEESAKKLSERKNLSTDSFEATQKFKLHQHDTSYALHRQKFDNIEEATKLEENEEKYRMAYVSGKK